MLFILELFYAWLGPVLDLTCAGCGGPWESLWQLQVNEVYEMALQAFLCLLQEKVDGW